MDAKTFAQVALRLLAVYLILWGLVGLPSVVLALMGYSVPMVAKIDIRFILASILAPFVIGILLWPASPTLGRWIAGKVEPDKPSVPLDVTRIQAAAFVVLGTWLAIRALSELLAYEAVSVEVGDPGFWRHVVELVLSLCLIAGAKTLARLAVRFREFGATAGHHNQP